MIDVELRAKAEAVLAHCRERGWRLACAESCTGGLLMATLTGIAGASDCVERGFVTYSNQAKIELLGVEEALLAAHGAVSEAVARAMALGAIARSSADLAVSVTGIAGPGGGDAKKPVGLVYLALARRNAAPLSIARLYGDIGRDRVRRAAVADALALFSSA